MTNSRLFDLPNELLLFIFGNLTSLDLFMTFFDLKSYRTQTLLKDFLATVDITQQDNQVASVSKYIPLGDLQASEVISSGVNNQIPEGDLIEFRRYLKKFSIIIRCAIGKENFIRQLFPSASYSTCRFYYPNNDGIYICPQLTHLTIDVTPILMKSSCLSNVYQICKN